MKEIVYNFIEILSIMLFMYIFIKFLDYVNFSRPTLYFNPKMHYVDLDGNKGIADYCDDNMVCVVGDKKILVKEYYEVYK